MYIAVSRKLWHKLNNRIKATQKCGRSTDPKEMVEQKALRQSKENEMEN